MKEGIYIISKKAVWQVFIIMIVLMYIFMLMRQDFFAGIFSGFSILILIILFGNEWVWKKKQEYVNNGLGFEK